MTVTFFVYLFTRTKEIGGDGFTRGKGRDGELRNKRMGELEIIGQFYGFLVRGRWDVVMLLV